MRFASGRWRTLGLVSALAVASAALVPTAGSSAREPAVSSDGTAAERTNQSSPQLRPMGRANLRTTAHAAARESIRESAATHRATANPETELPPRIPDEGVPEMNAPRLAPRATNVEVVDRHPGVMPFDSLSAVDSRYAFDGNQFTNEPPDQALCVGNGYEMASVNVAIAVYDRQGSQLAPTVAINEFFGLAPSFNRDKETFGPFAFDPVCYYDQQVQRWFFLVTELDQDVFSGALTGASNLYLAVSATSDPLGDYAFYSINTTNGDRTDEACPCFDDFPHIGADRNGFYISTNRFSLVEPVYNGAQLYAISKRGLAANAADPSQPVPTLVSRNAGPIDGDPSFTVQPMTVSNGNRFPGNRQYFLSTTDFDTRRESKIGIWAFSNTDSLDQDKPQLRLTRRTIPSRTYVLEPDTEQRIGRRPLGMSVGEPLNKLDSQSDMTEPMYSRGRLWAAISTAVGRGEHQRIGVLWMQVRPFFTNGRVDGEIVRQGKLAVRVNSLLYPAVGVNDEGEGAIVMTLAGPWTYPSPVYVRFDNGGASGPVRVTERGQRPDDGFTCYAAFVGSRDRGCRWGDYSAADADPKGTIWMATEYIPNAERLPLANWGTMLLRYNPDSPRIP